MRKFLILFAICMTALVTAEPYKNLVPNYNRLKSNAMVRQIEKPTLANLDYSAYIDNPVRLDPEKFNPKISKKLTFDEFTFSGLVNSACDSLSQTSLTKEEMENPLAWTPLQNRLWEALKTDVLSKFSSTVNGEKWGDVVVFKAFQELAATYLHKTDKGTEMWVRIEFQPWVKAVSFVNDNDKDGFREIYARLNLDSVDPSILEKLFTWIRDDYQTKILTKEEVVDWTHIMASYWYPTMNTDIIEMGSDTIWPNSATESENKKTMKKVVVTNPLVVIRGRPFQKPIYNVYVVNTKANEKSKLVEPAQKVGLPDKIIDTTTSKNFKDNNARFDQEIKLYGDYATWAKKNSPFFDNVKKMITALPTDQMGFKGKDDWLFFRKSIDYTLGGDLSIQPKDKNAIPNLADFQKYLKENNINLLFVVVPNKEEVYSEKLPVEMPKLSSLYVNPYSRKILKDLQGAGIEVIDLLPAFLKAKQDDSKNSESVYQHQDTHWSNRGLEIASEMIAARVKEYTWYKDISDKVAFTMVDTTFDRQGDIVDKLPELERVKFPAVNIKGQKVYSPDGKPYKGSATSPIMLIGDSFTGVFELVDCKNAGVGSHIAQKTGVSVDIITSWGGGPMVRQKAMRAREKDLPYKRLVIYMMVARDLYNYGQGWEPFPAK